MRLAGVLVLATLAVMTAAEQAVAQQHPSGVEIAIRSAALYVSAVVS